MSSGIHKEEKFSSAQGAKLIHGREKKTIYWVSPLTCAIGNFKNPNAHERRASIKGKVSLVKEKVLQPPQ